MNDKLYRSIGDLSQVVEDRHITGYAAVFETESNFIGFYETIARGAITQELVDRCDVFCRFNHDENKILARSNMGEGSLKLTVDNIGLKYEFDAPKTALGDELLEYISRGELNKSSFCFALDAKDDNCQRWEKRDGKIYRTINKIAYIFDVAPVFTPAYSNTSCDQRSLDEYKRFVDEEENKDDENIMKEEEKALDEQEIKPDEPEKEKEQEETQEERKSINEEQQEEEKPVEEEQKEENTEKENRQNNTMKKEFSLLKAIRDVANNRSLDAMTEKICGEARNTFNTAGLTYGGQIQLPTEELRATITVEAEGEDVVATDIFSIMEPLRAKNVLVQAGAKFLTGLVGDVQIPVMSASNVYWEAETANAKDGAGAFTNIKMSPKRLTAYIDISKQFLAQDGVGAETLIRQDLVNAINAKLEATILGNAAGSVTQPAGLFYGHYYADDTTPATKISDFSGITGLEAGVENANVFGEMKYIVAPSAKGALRAMPKGTKLINPVMENGTIDGTPVLSTSNVPANLLVYGDFTNLAIGSWGAIDLTVDPYTKAGAGQIRLVINAYFDAVVLRPEAFAFGTTANLSNKPSEG